MSFRPDFGVYVCPHVFNRSRPVLESVRDPEGDWQMLCGIAGCVEESEPHYVGVGHLVERDSSIDELSQLRAGMFAERASPDMPWLFGELSD